jgi:hypothetical protein
MPDLIDIEAFRLVKEEWPGRCWKQPPAETGSLK